MLIREAAIRSHQASRPAVASYAYHRLVSSCNDFGAMVGVAICCLRTNTRFELTIWDFLQEPRKDPYQGVRYAYARAFEQWWDTRPDRFRVWGPISNFIAVVGGEDRVCEDYAKSAAQFMNDSVDIRGTRAYPNWTHWRPRVGLSDFGPVENTPVFAHNNVQVWAKTKEGNVVFIVSFDPWSRL